MLQASFLTRFQCLGDTCEDTCCKGWSMQLDDAMHEKYAREAPGLLTAVDEEDGQRIMKRDPSSDYCVKFDAGWCGIHKEKGADFLGDACYFYPRVTRRLGGEIVMTAAPSCPEIVRLALFSAEDPSYLPHDTPRLPHTLKQYLPEELSAEQALSLHRAFLDTVLKAESAEQGLAHISGVARSLMRLPVASWPEAAPFYLKSAALRLPAPEGSNDDPFNLLHALMGLHIATRKRASQRLLLTISEMETALGATLDWQDIAISLNENSHARAQALHEQWQAHYAKTMAEPFKRWLALQLSVALFPFSGLGETLVDRVTILGVRFATLKLALMCHAGIAEAMPSQDVVVRIVQSLARLLDHLGDPAYSVQVYGEAGWGLEGRLYGLITCNSSIK